LLIFYAGRVIRADLMRAEGKHAAARAYLEDARAACEALLRDSPDVTQTQVLLAESLAGIGRARRAQGQADEALCWFAKAQAVLGKAGAALPRHPSSAAAWQRSFGRMRRLDDSDRALSPPN
jgi:hypothetical protein